LIVVDDGQRMTAWTSGLYFSSFNNYVRPQKRAGEMSTERIPVLMYHRVGEAHNAWERKYCVSAHRFAEHMRMLKHSDWQAVSIKHFFAWLDGEAELPRKSFVLTFDDGFLGVYEHAAPVLAALNWPATVFLVSKLIGKQDTWCESHNPSGATYPLMDASHIEQLRSQGLSFQSHTRCHTDLPTLADEALRDQLAGSREDLQSLLGCAVDYLAYPYGRYDERVLRETQLAGYLGAFSVQPGFNRRDADRFRIRRLDVFGTDSAAALRRKIMLGCNDGSLMQFVRYGANRIRAHLGLRRP
jgi:peptidoglycan/xylan/chitin deacetylase (PgdA/CDA1 family)